MFLLVTSTYCLTADQLVKIADQKKIHVFRLNMDQYFSYQFLWNRQGFEIIDPLGRNVESDKIIAASFYKATLPDDFSFQSHEIEMDKNKWIRKSINYTATCLAGYLAAKCVLRLWQPTEYRFNKINQMNMGKKFFSVPSYAIHWGFVKKSKEIITKTLVQTPITDQEYGYCTKTNQALLSPMYPWFTQEIAEGNRDATVVYINGHVHCYKFATERGNLTDWRVTQGTDDNKWEPWDAGHEFEQKIDAFMKEIGLKFGRLDFIIGGKEPQFLEVNPCGQFGWLDDEKLTLHNEVVDAIMDRSSTIRI